MSTSTKQIHIRAVPKKIYNAFMDPELLTKFLVPHEMSAKISEFRSGVGGGYRMILSYPGGDNDPKGKTTEHEDGYTSKFSTLEPYSKIVCLINFDSNDEKFQGEMTETISLHPHNGGTEVKIEFENIPKGIDPKDNIEGTASSLEKLRKLMED
ncbi:MAG: ATPase [Chitinophagaceae bacterium]|nr:MAG: ATPase [Chitinophagaceae bacterium]